MSRPALLTPLPHRIVGALFLQPMTVPELMRCLTRSRDAIRFALYELRDRGMVEIGERRRGRTGQPQHVYRLAWLRR